MSNKWSNITKEELINLLCKKALELGRSPKNYEFKSSDEYPSVHIFYIKFDTYSWTKILQIAGLDIDTRKESKEIRKEKYLKGFINLFNKLGRLPTVKEVNEDNNCANNTWYTENYGSLKMCAKQFNLLEDDICMNQEQRLNYSLTQLQNLAKKLNKIPTIKEYNDNNKNGFSSQHLIKILNMTYNDICRKFILSDENFKDYRLNTNYSITKEEIINNLIDLKEKLGRTPKLNELSKHGLYYDLGMFKRKFNLTYNDFIQSMGWELSSNERTGDRKTEDDLIEDYLQLFHELKRIPYVHEIDERQNMVTYYTYVRKFGSIDNLLALLGIDYDKNYKITKMNKFISDLNGGFCRSVIEKDITDYFINNNIEYEKEPYYKDIIPNFRSKKRLDWKIKLNDKIYYVEYFGLYNPKYKTKVSRSYVKKTRKKIKYLYKAGLIDQCIFIFPNDIKDNTAEGLQRKLESFLLRKYNIDIKKIA